MKSLLHESSTNLHSSRYDPAAKELFVTFKDGDNPGVTWRYFGVEPERYGEIEQAQASGESVGKLFHSKIRSQYRGEPVE